MHRTELGSNRAAARAAEQLAHLMRMINQTVGDALSDLLLVEAAIIVLGLDLPTWEAQYTDLPNRLSKVNVGRQRTRGAGKGHVVWEEVQEKDALCGKRCRTRTRCVGRGRGVWEEDAWCEEWTHGPNRAPAHCLKQPSPSPAPSQVKDRSIFETTDAERKVVLPAGLQALIDAAVAQYPSARSFVRCAQSLVQAGP